jgi:hypothetical protein
MRFHVIASWSNVAAGRFSLALPRGCHTAIIKRIRRSIGFACSHMLNYCADALSRRGLVRPVKGRCAPLGWGASRQYANGRRGFVSDIFNEVDEEVRREQLKKLWERYGNYIVALAFLVVAAVAGWRGYEYWEGRRAAVAGAAYDAAAQLAAEGKHDEAEAAFAKLVTDGTAGYRVLARLREAAVIAERDPKAAVAAGVAQRRYRCPAAMGRRSQERPRSAVRVARAHGRARIAASRSRQALGAVDASFRTPRPRCLCGRQPGSFRLRFGFA